MNKQPDKKSFLSNTHKIRIFIPGVNFYPLDKAQNWADRYYSQICHTSGHRRKAIHSKKQFDEKIAKPLLDKTRQAINKDFISRSELNYCDIIKKQEKNLLSPEASKRYMKGLDRVYRTVDGVKAKLIKDKLPLYAVNYAEKMTFGSWRLNGPMEADEKSAMEIISGWLLGEPGIKESLRKRDEMSGGIPASILADEKKKGIFKVKLRSRLMRSLTLICASNYYQDEIKIQNDKINGLINEFCLPADLPAKALAQAGAMRRLGAKDLTPFASGSNSYIDFVSIPETAELRDSPKLVELRNKIQHFFLGDKFTPEEPEILPAGKKASDFINDPFHPICMDMYLEMQVNQI